MSQIVKWASSSIGIWLNLAAAAAESRREANFKWFPLIICFKNKLKTEISCVVLISHEQISTVMDQPLVLSGRHLNIWFNLLILPLQLEKNGRDF